MKIKIYIGALMIMLAGIIMGKTSGSFKDQILSVNALGALVLIVIGLMLIKS